MKRRWRLVLSVVSLLLGPTTDAAARSSAAMNSISSAWSALRLAVPAGRPHSFTVAGPGFVLVPAGDRVDIAGWGANLVPAIGVPILEIAETRKDGELFAVLGGATKEFVRLIREGGAWKVHPIAELSEGRYHLQPDGGGAVWLGVSDGRKTNIYHGSAKRIDLVATSDVPLQALASAGPNAAVVALGDTLVLLRSDRTKLALRRIDAPLDGLAVGNDGTVYASTPTGVFAIERRSKPKQISRGVHGALLYRAGHLYVLWSERQTIIALRPAAP